MNELEPYQAPLVNPEDIKKLEEEIPIMSTKNLVDYFTALKDVHKYTTSFEKAVNAELKNRSESGGKDEKGNSYLSGKRGAVRVERRYSFSLTDDAVSTLAGLDLLGLFPMVPRLDAMRQILRELGVEDSAYMEPQVSVEALGDLVEKGLIDGDVAASIVQHKVTLATRVIEQKALPDDTDISGD